MPKVKIHVWHNNEGQIIAIGRPVSKNNVVPITKSGHSVLETEVDEKLIKKLHETHKVDREKKSLVKATD